MVLKNYGNPQTLVDGFHFDIFCLLELGAGDVSVSVNGFLGPIPSNYQYGGGTGNVMIVGDPTVAEGDCIIPLIDPAHSTTDFLCQPFTGTSNLPNYPAAVYLINPTTHTGRSGCLAGVQGSMWPTGEPSTRGARRAPRLRNPNSRFQGHPLRASLNPGSRIATLLCLPRGFAVQKDIMKIPQEGTSMKRLLLVMGFVALFSLAASAKTPSTTYNFQFLTVNGDPYCDGMFLNNYGNPQVLVDGFHSDPYCAIELGIGYIPSFGVNGFVTTVASNYQYGGGSGTSWS